MVGYLIGLPGTNNEGHLRGLTNNNFRGNLRGLTDTNFGGNLCGGTWLLWLLLQVHGPSSQALLCTLPMPHELRYCFPALCLVQRHPL